MNFLQFFSLLSVYPSPLNWYILLLIGSKKQEKIKSYAQFVILTWHQLLFSIKAKDYFLSKTYISFFCRGTCLGRTKGLVAGFFKKLLSIYLLLAVLGLCCCTWIFSSCREWGQLSSCSGFSFPWLLSFQSMGSRTCRLQ